MYAIYEKTTQKLICTNASLRAPNLAWMHFRENYWEKHRTLPDGRVLDWAKDHREYFECRMTGERSPIRVPGHALRIQSVMHRGAPASFEGKCGCGWSQDLSTRQEVKDAHRSHLESLPNVDLTPRPAQNLPAVKRAEESLKKFEATGGERKTFRLPKQAIEELDRMVTTENHPSHTAALEALLLQQRKAVPDSSASLYALHVEDDEVQEVVDRAVQLACRELDELFPGAAPDGGKGVSSNFQGLLVDHVKAMLTGQMYARRGHYTQLPVLLANDNVFGRPFDIADQDKKRGAGYVVISPATNQVLSVYSGRFMRVYRGRSQFMGHPRLEPLFGEHSEECLAEGAELSEYEGRELHFQDPDADILFTSYEGATETALKALRAEGEAPATQPLKIVAAAYDGGKNCFVVLPRKS
jgi:hypothetical protein